MNKIEAIRHVFAQLMIDYVEPYLTTEGDINRGLTGRHRGLYYIYPEVNFYFGKAATNTVRERHQTHRAKLDVDLKKLYGPPVVKKQPRWSFPDGWRAGVCRYIIEGTDHIPDHFVRVGKQVAPGVLDFPVTHRVQVDTIPVLVWNLEHLPAHTISEIEELVIPAIWPYCNAETHRRRLESENSLFGDLD